MGFKLRDSILTGVVPGLIIPAIILLILVFLRKGESAIADYFQAIYSMGILPKLISICLVPNLILFFGFLRFNRMRSARGVLLSMFVAAAVIGVLKIL